MRVKEGERARKHYTCQEKVVSIITIMLYPVGIKLKTVIMILHSGANGILKCFSNKRHEDEA